MLWQELILRWQGNAIRNCPGRYILKAVPTTMTPAELLGDQFKIISRRSVHARDEILIVKFADGGGLITYRRDEQSYLHTINDPSGFARKLAQLELTID